MKTSGSALMDPHATGRMPAPGEPLVCVVDDEKNVRQSLERLLRSAGYATRTHASAHDYLAAAPHPGPCCLILDMNMPDVDGFGLQHELEGHAEQIVFLTGYGDVPMCARAMKSGAIDFLGKPVDDEALLEAVERALIRSAKLCAAMSTRERARRKLAALTGRERSVFERVVAGMLNKQIAADLDIAEKTVKVHRGRMMRKAGVVSVPDLVRLAIAAGCAPVANTEGVKP
ncbi:MAG TPA: response regulator [Luteolibacter sp.]|nr:response regulator [Luteolibacter sp.]